MHTLQFLSSPKLPIQSDFPSSTIRKQRINNVSLAGTWKLKKNPITWVKDILSVRPKRCTKSIYRNKNPKNLVATLVLRKSFINTWQIYTEIKPNYSVLKVKVNWFRNLNRKWIYSLWRSLAESQQPTCKTCNNMQQC